MTFAKIMTALSLVSALTAAGVVLVRHAKRHPRSAVAITTLAE